MCVLGAQQAALSHRGVDRRPVHVRLMHDVCHQRLGARCRAPCLGEPDPEIPVGDVVKRFVEAAETSEELGARHNVRRAGEDEVAAADAAFELLGRKRRAAVEHPAVEGRDRHPGGIGEVRCFRLGSLELHAELVRAPAIVVVEERRPGMRGALDAPITRVSHATVDRVSQHRDTWVTERLEVLSSPVAGTVVDHDHFEIDVALAQGQAHGIEHDLQPVARRDDDGHAFSHRSAAVR